MSFQLLAAVFLLPIKEAGWTAKLGFALRVREKSRTLTRIKFWFHGLTSLVPSHCADWASSLIVIIWFQKFTYHVLYPRRIDGPMCGSFYSYVIRTDIRNMWLFASTTIVLVHDILLTIHRSVFIYWIIRFLGYGCDTMRLDIVDTCLSI
jgi:hypothetical protein